MNRDEALKLAITHIEHMAAWIARSNEIEGFTGYSFEGLGEDLPWIKAALAGPADNAVEERDALLSALGWKTGPFPDAGTRKVVLEDSAGLRPEMVKARRRADDAEADRDIWRMIAGERVEEARSGLLIRVWNRMKEERKLRIKAEAAIAGPAAEDKARIDFLDMRRPIKGIEYRSAEEVFAIMADRIRLAEGGHYRLPVAAPAEGSAANV